MEISDLLLEERETHINQTANDRSKWIIYTDDPVWINRLDKMLGNDEVTRTANGIGFLYVVPVSYVRVKPPRKLSEEHKAKLREQLAKRRK